MKREVRVYDPRQRKAVAIRLGDIPSLFSEAQEPEAQLQSSPSLDAVKSWAGQILRQLQTSRPLTAAPAAGSR